MLVLQQLLRPGHWDAATSTPLTEQQWALLCDATEQVLAGERSCLQLRAPIKVFGDLHGQFGDLMRLFEAFGSPSRSTPGGDLAMCDYLFLGDYVDRGAHSLETVALLFALKVAYPRNVFLLRGNHESSQVNHVMGFFEECVERMGRASGERVWTSINRCFDWLPLAAVIDGRALCVHGGLGQSLRTIGDIDAVRRPLSVPDGGAILTDILWSDPTEDDSIVGVHPNTKRGPGTFAFGPDRVRSFCDDNGLELVIRGHECVMDGFERFAQGQLVTVFSATNYCGVVGNSGCCMLVDRDLQCHPQIIVPNLPPAPPSPPTPLWPHGSDALDFQEPGIQASALIDAGDGTAQSRLEALCVASASTPEEAAAHEKRLRDAFASALEAQEAQELEEAEAARATDERDAAEGAEASGEGEGDADGDGVGVGAAGPRREGLRARALRFGSSGTWRKGTIDALPPTPADLAAARALTAAAAGAEPADTTADATVAVAAAASDASCARVVEESGENLAASVADIEGIAGDLAAFLAGSAGGEAPHAEGALPAAAVPPVRTLSGGVAASPLHMASGNGEDPSPGLSSASAAVAVAVA